MTYICVYEDKLSVWNPAVLPHGWTVEKLRGDHPSIPFNPDIANTFFRAGEIEAWGRGIHRIYEACSDANVPEPHLNFETGELLVEFPFSPEYL
jgi:ATP-dependent DNA helicase RecG